MVCNVLRLRLTSEGNIRVVHNSGAHRLVPGPGPQHANCSFCASLFLCDGCAQLEQNTISHWAQAGLRLVQYLLHHRPCYPSEMFESMFEQLEPKPKAGSGVVCSFLVGVHATDNFLQFSSEMCQQGTFEMLNLSPGHGQAREQIFCKQFCRKSAK